MKRILSILLIIGIFLPFLTLQAQASSDYFVVTAYYSPLPNQDNYSFSTYTNRERTYKEEKRLQGEGIRGASGKKVFSGMLASPKKYRFGTKIYLQGLGIGVVEDRGGAIVKAGQRGYSYDRIDVWMGYGDEGLKRAITWGKRTIKGNIVSKNNNITIDYKKVQISKEVLKKYKKKKEIINIFNKNLKTVNEIKKLQTVLTQMNFYNGDINGIYKNTIDAVYDFQVSAKILNSPYTYGAGTYGPKTRKLLKEQYEGFLVKKEEQRLELVKVEEKRKKEELKKKELAKKLEKNKQLSNIKAENKVKIIANVRFGEISHSVRELQVTLKQLGYFENKDTAIYGKITKQSIISYQIDKKIINTKNDFGAGIFGPKTKKSLQNDLEQMFLKQITKKENEIIKI